MTMCVIEKLQIGPTQLVVDKTKKKASPQGAEADKLGCYSVTECSLTEEFLKPHEFRFTLRRDLIDKSSAAAKGFEIVENLIGQSVICTVETNLEGNKTKFTFEGRIAGTSMKGLNIDCVALSSDTLLHGIRKSCCYTNIKLEDLINQLIKGGAKVSVHTVFKNLTFPYLVQYNETDYEFIVRLAKRFGQFFYHEHGSHDAHGGVDKSIVFGKLAKTQDADVLDITEASGLSYELHTINSNFKLLSHFDEKNIDIVSGVAGLGDNHSNKIYDMAVAASPLKQSDLKVFVDYPNGFPSTPVPDDTLMTNLQKAMTNSMSSGLAICKFTCYAFNVGVGRIVKVKGGNKMMVTSAKLSWDCNGSPQNEITAIMLPADNTTDENIFAPYMDINAYPKSSAQRAEVFDNVDPLKMGRVQVFFAWQKELQDSEKANLPWIRIAQPYGGDKDGKGFYVLPEKKEEVMVGFEHDNMEKPFVIGSLFHNSDKAEQKQLPADDWCEVAAKGGNPAKNEENEVKAFRTKKGHTIEIHDTKQGDGFIRIYGREDKKPNYDIILSTDPIKTGQNKDQIYKVKSASADKDEGFDEYKAEKLRIFVCSYDGDIVLDAGKGDIIMNANNIRFHTTGDRTAYVEGDDVVKVNNKQYDKTKLSNLVVDDKRNVYVENEDHLQSSKVEIDVSDNMKITSKTLASSTSDKTEIKAAKISAGADKDVKVKANSGLELDGGAKTDMKGSNVNVEADASAIVKGDVVVVEGEGTTNIKAASILIDASSGTRKGNWVDI